MQTRSPAVRPARLGQHEHGAQALWGQFQSIQGLYNTLSKEQKDLVLDLVGLAFDIESLRADPDLRRSEYRTFRFPRRLLGGIHQLPGSYPLRRRCRQAREDPSLSRPHNNRTTTCLPSPDDGVRDGDQEDHDLGLPFADILPVE